MENRVPQSGTIIILAILIIAAVLSTALIFSNLILRDLQQSRLLDQSLQAYYGAESGSERALHQVRRRSAIVNCSALDNDQNAFCDEATSRCSNVPAVPCTNSTDGNITLAGGWDLGIVNEPSTSIPLSKGQSFQLDLFDPAEVAQSNVDSIAVSHNSGGGLSFLGELSNLTNILQINNPAVSNCLVQPPVLKGRINAPTQINGLDGVQMLQDCSYIFRLTYPQDAAGNATVATISLFNQSSGQQLDIPSRLIINASATFGNSFQTVSVRTPSRPPLSGLYDFVLFSEEEIIKLNQ